MKTAASTGITLMLMLVGAALVALALDYRWVTVAIGGIVILVAIVTALAMPAPAKPTKAERLDVEA